jgi:hypothetical protein
MAQEYECRTFTPGICFLNGLLILELFFGIGGLAFSLIILQFGCAADHTHLLNETISL